MQQVTAGVIVKNGKILIAKRKPGKCIGSKWEFPGGKLEQNESHHECLKRELQEELNIETEIGDFICSSKFQCSDINIELLAYKVSYLFGEIKLSDHTEMQWVLPSELKNYDFAEADLPVIDEILKENNLI